MFSDVSTFSPQYVTYPLVSMMHDPKQNACSFFSVVVISVDAKNKALKVLCIGFLTQGDKFFHHIVGLYYPRKADTPNHYQKTHPCWSKKASRTLGL